MRLAYALALIPLHTAALASDAPLAPSPGATPQVECQKPAMKKVDRAVALRARPLTEEPPAKHIAAVYRSIDGCVTPVVLRDGIGSGR